MRRFVLLVSCTSFAMAGALTATPHAVARGQCGNLHEIVIAGVTTCTHGGDEPVPDLTPSTNSRSLSGRSIPAAPCPGDGHTGRRIRVVLGYPSDTAGPDVATARRAIRDTIAIADHNLDDQSTSIGQHYRFWCKRDRGVTINVVAMAPIGKDGTYTFTDVANALGAAGFKDPKFVYSAFVANIDCCYPYGGQGSLAVDDQPDPASNANNAAFTRYSMIRFDAGLSTTSLALAFQHEVGHNLGAVQDSAPHTSGAFHCYETYDVMCYNDGGPYFVGGGQLVSVCGDPSTSGLYAFDCGGDDYYNVAPAANTYLSDHWNVANSRWLTPVGASGR